MTDMELRVHTGGYIARSLSDIIASMSRVIGLYPGYAYQSTSIEQTVTGDMIHIYYADETTNPKAEAIPLIIYAILAALTALGIAYVTYEIFVVAPKSPWGQVTIIAGALTAAVLFVNAIRKKSEG